MASAESLRVSVAYSPRAGVVDEAAVTLAAGATLLEAIRASGVMERHAQIDLGVQRVGIWGRLMALETTLRDHDRVEIYRPLQVDPKEARRLRQRRQAKKKVRAAL